MIEKNGSDSSSVSLARHIPSDFHNYSFLTVIFVGDEDSAILPLWLLTHVNCSKVFTYFPKTGDASLSCSNATQHLRKRLFLIEKIRDATTIGLVVGTIDTLGHREVVKRMRKLCRAAGKKLYVFSIGKVNEAKISNFANDIDIFVIISCPLGVILDKRNYIRPLVSLFEAEIALNDYHDWSCGKGWTAEFSNFVNDAIEVNGLKEPDISMITGRLRTNGCDEVDESSNYCRDICSYVAGNHFGTRSWKGLDDVSTGMETLQLQEGRSGIASGYNIEPVDA